MIYQVSIMGAQTNHQGYTYFSSKAAAEKFLRDVLRAENEPDEDWDDEYEAWDTTGEITAMPTPKNKRDMLRMLDRWATHNDNG